MDKYFEHTQTEKYVLSKKIFSDISILQSSEFYKKQLKENFVSKGKLNCHDAKICSLPYQ